MKHGQEPQRSVPQVVPPLARLAARPAEAAPSLSLNVGGRLVEFSLAFPFVRTAAIWLGPVPVPQHIGVPLAAPGPPASPGSFTVVSHAAGWGGPDYFRRARAQSDPGSLQALGDCNDCSSCISCWCEGFVYQDPSCCLECSSCNTCNTCNSCNSCNSCCS